MPSSRATIAAGTSPPRVTQTIAWNGPAPASRQASARIAMELIPRDRKGLVRLRLRLLERLRHRSPTGKGWDLLAHVEHEIEPRSEPVAGLRHSHHQLAAEQSVTAVHRLVRKVELGGKHA